MITRRLDTCVGCKEEKEVQERKITLPTGHVATSHDAMCDECYSKFKAIFNAQHHE